MMVLLIQKITLLRKSEYTNIMKTFESNIIPHKGDYIEDSAWNDPFEYQVQEVTLNYEENECYVELPEILINSNDRKDLDKYIENIKSFRWIETN